MGFRNLLAFNKALLAKQMWRLIQYPNSIMAKAFKARYFRNSDIMVAEIGYRPSYVCRSLLWGRDLIQKGLCWRVGDEKLISVKDDHWIPKLPGFKSNIGYLASSSDKASTLMNGHDNWDEDAIRNLFPPVAAEAILDIQLSRRGCADTRFWQGYQRGMYKVRHVICWKLMPWILLSIIQLILIRGGGRSFGAFHYRQRFGFFCGEHPEISFLQLLTCFQACVGRLSLLVLFEKHEVVHFL